jgi:hypothetical protein
MIFGNCKQNQLRLKRSSSNLNLSSIVDYVDVIFNQPSLAVSGRIVDLCFRTHLIIVIVFCCFVFSRETFSFVYEEFLSASLMPLCRAVLN